MSLTNPFEKNWKKVQTCNLSLYKVDFTNIGGFDESYIGWGSGRFRFNSTIN